MAGTLPRKGMTGQLRIAYSTACEPMSVVSMTAAAIERIATASATRSLAFSATLLIGNLLLLPFGD
jgi:hypothetical protein